jgi:hypothetical protein
MATEELTIRYPAGFERAVHLTKAEMEQHLRLMAALKMFELGKISDADALIKRLTTDPHICHGKPWMRIVSILLRCIACHTSSCSCPQGTSQMLIWKRFLPLP